MTPPLLRRRIAAALPGVRCPRWLYDWIWGETAKGLQRKLADVRADLASAEEHESELEAALAAARPFVAAWVECRSVRASDAAKALQAIDAATGGLLSEDYSEIEQVPAEQRDAWAPRRSGYSRKDFERDSNARRPGGGL